MVAPLEQSRTSTGAATLIGAVVGLAVVCLYLGAGLLVGGWSISDFLTHLSPGTIGYFVGMIVLVVAFVGLPIAGQNAGRQVARLGMIALVSLAGGPAALAAYHIGSQVATVAFVPAQGLAQAATSVVGQNLGADQPGRRHGHGVVHTSTSRFIPLVFSDSSSPAAHVTPMMVITYGYVCCPPSASYPSRDSVSSLC
jgi:Na+-driven multidrug efflux pump